MEAGALCVRRMRAGGVGDDCFVVREGSACGVA
jgi:hypothetical protein